MAKIKGWKKTEEITREVRRPMGKRIITQKTYLQETSINYLNLITAPRRPQFQSLGIVELDGKEIFKGSKNEAIDYAYNFMENYGNTRLHDFSNVFNENEDLEEYFLGKDPKKHKDYKYFSKK